ncbi:MAG: hypothetical protein ACU0BO_03150 [Limimaricola soesokkakensis]|uniref:hypothetical protein n=1 Tax=Limimaricola soesokkakensis TaxID=1343159 RepID=UPI004058D7DC
MLDSEDESRQSVCATEPLAAQSGYSIAAPLTSAFGKDRTVAQLVAEKHLAGQPRGAEVMTLSQII